jgi:anti-sigma factor RsiW
MGTRRSIGRCEDVRQSLGVYVLGAAEPAERALVRLHLTWCRACREELAELAGLPGLLRRVPAADADRLLRGEDDPEDSADAPSEVSLPTLLGRTAKTRRTRRWLAVAATAAAVAVAAGSGVAASGGFGLGASAHSQVDWETFSARNQLTLASAIVRYAPTRWGAQVEVRVSGIAPGTACQLLVTGSRGQERIGGSWTVVPGDSGTWIPASTSLPANSVVGFAVLAGGKTLVSVPATES